MNTPKLTSRSALETYISKCQRARYLGYEIELLDGCHGLQPTYKSIDLIFGNAVHFGCQLILEGSEFLGALKLAQEDFRVSTFNAFDKDIDQESEQQKDYSLIEHSNLLEALLYAWFVSEYQELKRTHKVIAVEREIENEIANGIILQSRVDAILLNNETSELITYSLKTIKQTGFFSEMMQNRDLQGYLEMFATEKWLKKCQDSVARLNDILHEATSLPNAIKTNINKYLARALPLDIEKVDRVRFCFLVKGKRDKKNGGEYPRRDNPYLYGYRRLNQDHTYQYAHSFSFYNPNNASGEGRLGKGWEKFSVWEDYDLGICKWIDDINAGIIQPEAINPITKIVHVPEPVIRNEDMQALTLETAANTEIDIGVKMLRANPEAYFMPNHKSCTMPTICEFYDYCYRPEIRQDPIGSGLYQIRINHHKREGE